MGFSWYSVYRGMARFTMCGLISQSCETIRFFARIPDVPGIDNRSCRTYLQPMDSVDDNTTKEVNGMHETPKRIMTEIAARRAFRGFSTRPVEQDVLERIIEAATLAPSCMNKQPWRFIVLSQEQPERLAAGFAALSGGNYWAHHAGALIFALTRADLDCQPADGRAYAPFDTGLAVGNMLLQAVHEGLIGHPMAGFSPDAVREAFPVAEGYTVMVAVAFGYPAESEEELSYLNEKHREAERAPRVRKPLEEVVFTDGRAQ